MAWIAGLAVVALVLAGWRKTARAQPKRPRSPSETPRRVPYQVAEAVAPPYQPAGPLRRVWAVVASSGLALVIGAMHRHRHGVQPGVDRHHAHRPAQAVTDRRAVAVAGHTGDVGDGRGGARPPTIPACGRRALGALERLGRARRRPRSPSPLADPDAGVRRRAAEIAARHPGVDLSPALGRRRRRRWWRWRRGRAASTRSSATACSPRSIGLAGGAGAGREPLVREAAVAALGAIGDDRGLDAILAATTDRPAIRRRAVLALAPFVDPDHPRAAEVAAALERARRRPRLAGPPGRRGPRPTHPDADPSADRRRHQHSAWTITRMVSEGVAVDVGVAGLEAEALVEAVGAPRATGGW